MQRYKDTEPLMKNRLFTGIDSSKFKMKLRHNNFLSFREGDIIFQKGDAGENIYLILEGEVKLKVHSAESGTNIFRKGKNDFFGETELLEKLPRSSSAIANSDCVLYTLSRQELYELMTANKTIKKIVNGEELDPFEEEAVKNEVLEEDEVISEELNYNNDSEEIQDSNTLQEESIEIPEDNFEDLIASSNIEEINEFSNEEFTEEGITLTELPNEILESDITEKDFEPISEKDFDEKPDDIIFSNGQDQLNNSVEENITEVNEYELQNFITENSSESLFSEPNIERHDTVQEENETFIDYKKLYQAVKKIHSGKDLEQTIRSTIEGLIDLFDAQIIRIFIAEKDTEELWSFPFMDNSAEIKKVKLGEGLIGGAAITREVINLNEPLADARYNPFVDSVENILIEDMILFPVINQNQELTSVIQMFNSGKNGFTDADIELLSILSPDISEVIEKAKAVSKPAAESERKQNSPKEEKTIEDESTYFSKASEFLTEDIKTSSSLLIRYLAYIKKKSESDEIKNASSLALQQAEIILKNTGVVSDFINGKSSLKKERIEIHKTIDEILELLAEYAESRKVKLFKKCQADASANIDIQALYLACYQIVKNACDAMPDGGNIYVTCGKEQDNLQIEFKDTGKGINEETKEKIFEPFFSLPEGKPGLGLSVANKIIKDHDGEIKINPEVSEGASFIITLPIAE